MLRSDLRSVFIVLESAMGLPGIAAQSFDRNGTFVGEGVAGIDDQESIQRPESFHMISDLFLDRGESEKIGHVLSFGVSPDVENPFGIRPRQEFTTV